MIITYQLWQIASSAQLYMESHQKLYVYKNMKVKKVLGAIFPHIYIFSKFL